MFFLVSASHMSFDRLHLIKINIVSAPTPCSVSQFSKGFKGSEIACTCSLQAIRYAQHTERILVVDWRDTDWTHDHQRFGFSEFLRVSGVTCFLGGGSSVSTCWPMARSFR